MKSLAIITARGGSKRIPRKNIKDFLGKPIIAYSIEAALSSGIFSEVMVSTDDNEIAEIAISLGAKVPFLRSKINSDDYSSTADVLLEVLGKYDESGEVFDYACCIYPTAPFVSKEKLTEANQLLRDNKAFSVIPVSRFGYPIWRSFKIENNKIAYNWPEFESKRSQDLPESFHDCGQFYFFNVSEFLRLKKLVSNNTIPLEIPESEMQDIDNEEDWKIAEIKYSLLKNKTRQI